MNAPAVSKDNSALNYLQDGAGYSQPERKSSGFLARIGSVVRWLATVQRRRAVMSELAMLTDHELADIGVTRSQLPSVLDAAFARQRLEDASLGHIRA